LPAQPPAWLGKVADSIGKDQGGSAKIKADWKRTIEEMQRTAREDEEVMPA